MLLKPLVSIDAGFVVGVSCNWASYEAISICEVETYTVTLCHITNGMVKHVIAAMCHANLTLVSILQ